MKTGAAMKRGARAACKALLDVECVHAEPHFPAPPSALARSRRRFLAPVLARFHSLRQMRPLVHVHRLDRPGRWPPRSLRHYHFRFLALWLARTAASPARTTREAMSPAARRPMAHRSTRREARRGSSLRSARPRDRLGNGGNRRGAGSFIQWSAPAMGLTRLSSPRRRQVFALLRTHRGSQAQTFGPRYFIVGGEIGYRLRLQ